MIASTMIYLLLLEGQKNYSVLLFLEDFLLLVYGRIVHYFRRRLGAAGDEGWQHVARGGEGDTQHTLLWCGCLPFNSRLGMLRRS